jgi:hypothetical protein
MKIILFFLVLFGAGLAWANELKGIESGFSLNNIDTYDKSLLEDRVKLSEISSLNPKKNLDAVIFFESEYSLEEVVTSDIVKNLKVKGFRHGNSEYSGGYRVKKEETLIEAVENYRSDHVRFLQRDEENMRAILESSYDDTQVRDAASARLKSVVGRQADYLKKGLKVIGLEVNASSRALMDLWNYSAYRVRTIKLKESVPVPNKFD